MNDLNKLKEKIVSGIKYAKEKLGFTLVEEDWGSKEAKCACALGCVLLANDHGIASDDAEQNEVEAAHVLGVSSEWIGEFIRGFDNESPENEEAEAVWELGKEIRNEFKPVNSTDYMKKWEEQQRNTWQ
jgi:hypothetical protein